MEEKLTGSLLDIWKNMGASENIASHINSAVFVCLILLLAYISNLIAKKIIRSYVTKFIKKSKTKYDDIFLDRQVFINLSHIIPALIIYYLIEYAIPNLTDIIDIVQATMKIYMLIVVLIVLNSFLAALNDIYLTFEISKKIPINTYIQVVKIILYFITIIFILSVILNESPVVFFTGLGAITAILLLIFKDTILGFVAGIQLTAYDMVKLGDWITMPTKNADGDVLDISLTTVKVRNFDKTITTIPTYALVAEPFINWKGMQECGGRRIKRSIYIDLTTIKFCTEEMLERFRKIKYLDEYLNSKQTELIQNDRIKAAGEVYNPLTNVGVFRYYLRVYFQEHPKIHNHLTLLVRQLAPSEKGLPLEIYVFSKIQNWTQYEELQADIFDHIIAITERFELKLFQSPSGSDISQLITKKFQDKI